MPLNFRISLGITLLSTFCAALEQHDQEPLLQEDFQCAHQAEVLSSAITSTPINNKKLIEEAIFFDNPEARLQLVERLYNHLMPNILVTADLLNFLFPSVNVINMRDKELAIIFRSHSLHFSAYPLPAGFLVEIESRANAGSAIAQMILGHMHYCGKGAPKNSPQAIEWLKLSAKQGNAQAQNVLGNHYLYGAETNKNEKEGIDWFRKAAEQGFPAAQCNLAYAYLTGTGKLPADDKLAAAWLLKAASQGLSEAQCLLADLFRSGRGVKKDDQRAFAWFLEAANQEFALAQFKVGYCYETGKGVRQDRQKAVSYYEKAADQGEGLGQLALAYCLEGGIGIKRDLKRSVELNAKVDEKTKARWKNLKQNW
ncbi:tetratricopeptide repeat protein [Candidatus Odyssella thessalonicensis]|uniref:tetratricopeptide repeat protein n=1 Tax=Candidatus Odyssella thessalonicensis TaxID=84647 RepID=UPI000225B72F|nr:tetratricopeptide repeat protein [Candidatus Odyssella thessalonicensis]